MAVLIATGIGLELAGVIDLKQILTFARANSDHWWLVVLLILLQALLFSFALAGSLFLWIVAPIYPPIFAALILGLGGTLGGIGAYLLSRYLTLEFRQKVERSHSYRVMRAQENFYTLFAMRVFPAFPHAIINYSAGMLKARLSHFIVAAMLGITIKSYIYARVIYNASSELAFELLLDFHILWPLVALSLGSVLVMYLSRR